MKKEQFCRIPKRCINYDICKGPCNPAEWINGNGRTVESLAEPHLLESVPQCSYNDSVYEMYMDKQMRDGERIEAIRGIKPVKTRAVYAMTFAEITQADIASLLRVSVSTVYRIFRGK